MKKVTQLVTMKADGIQGELTLDDVDGHTIPVEDWEKNLTAPGHVVNDTERSGSGRSVYDPFKVHKPLDKTSAEWEKRAHIQTPIDTLVLTVWTVNKGKRMAVQT